MTCTRVLYSGCQLGYWNIEIDERDRNKAALIFYHSLQRFKCMPFGQTNASLTFLPAMDVILPSGEWQFVILSLKCGHLLANSEGAHHHIQKA